MAWDDWVGGIMTGGLYNLGKAGYEAGQVTDIPEYAKAQQVNAQNVALNSGLESQQDAFARALQEQMAGRGPSLATTMLQNQAQQNAAQALGMAAANRGTNSGLALRQGLQAGQQANQQAAQQAAQARVGEQLGSYGMYGNQINQMQNQNLGMQQANQNAQLQAQMANQKAGLGAAGINAGLAQGNAANAQQFVGGIMSGAGALGGAAMGMSHGGNVPGKAPVSGDSLQNDQVPAMLSPNEIVLPRSVTMAKDAPQKAKEFVEHCLKMRRR